MLVSHQSDITLRLPWRDVSTDCMFFPRVWRDESSANRSLLRERERETERKRQRERDRERQRVSWCFKPSQPHRIKSGLRGTFIKRYIVERTSKAELRLEEQSEKWHVVERIYGMKYS